MRFTLRQLQVFLAVAHHGNVSRAADTLAMSQSAASSALQDLEQRYSTQLFDRVGKRLQLNAEGARLRPQAEALLDQAAEVEANLTGREIAGTLRVGATLTIGNYLAVPILASCMRQYPDLAVRLHVDNTEHIAQSVLNYEFDVGLIEGEFLHPDLGITAWQPDELVVFAAPGHPLAKQRAALSREQLCAVPWIVRESGSGTRQTFDRAMHDLASELNIHLELEHTEAIKRAVAAGLGVGCLSKIALADSFERGALAPLTVNGRDFTRNFYFVTHQRKYASRALEAFIACCKAESA